ncbi:MAG: glycine--tRNA ligase subunit beta [Lysobacterales bacterium]
MHKPDNTANKPDTPVSADLLIELGCEELPPKSLSILGQTLFDGFLDQLRKAELEFDAANSRAYYTPRRLALLISNVAGRQPDQVTERKGPALVAAFDSENTPTPAALGFARSVGKQLDELETLKTDAGEWLYCRLEKPGQALESLLLPMLETALAALPVAKPMRWASNDFSFVRPVHWLVVMHGSKVLNCRLFGLDAGNLTSGHRIHSPGLHEIPTAADYEQVLKSAHVIADQIERQDTIKKQVIELGKSTGGSALIDEGLLAEVTNLVEWPKSICGSFDEEFLSVPAEALIASMQDHQKFFPVVSDKQGKLMNRFIAVANLDSRDFNAVRKGFERVIRPRLSDARFFWEQDNKSPIEDWIKQLDNIVFQNTLGSVGDKSRRIASISQKIAEETGVDALAAKRAAMLCKCDLVSQMVGEFPELQGVMGRYYAIQSGEKDDVALAIGEHYLPAFSGDRLPSQAPGKVVALADRFDTLAGIFAAGLKPTGNKDPFALRRAALGLIRILLDGELDLELDRGLAIAALALQEQLPVTPQVLTELRQFILERLKHYLREQGYETGLVNAALDACVGTLPDLVTRLEALNDFMRHDAASNLVEANKRIGNILRKSGQDVRSIINEDILIIEEERLLFEEIRSISNDLDILYEKADYTGALTLLAGLSPVIDSFFDKVMVMEDNLDIRNNRLSLLAKLKGMFDRVANLALIG